MSKSKSKIILATGIFFPDIGGPAIHVRKIAEALTERGYCPIVIAYGDYSGSQEFPFKVIRVSNKLNPLIRRALYLGTVFRESFGARILYAFNIATAGFPVFIVGKILHKKIIIRVPGDPIWERIVEKGKRLVSFVNYYKQGLYSVDRPWLFRAIKFVLPRFDKLVFYTPFLAEIYREYYGVPATKINIILNPVSRKQPLNVIMADEPTMLFAGRFVAYKNLELVIRVFGRIRDKIGRGKFVLIGGGPDEERLTNVISQMPSAEHISIIPKVSQEKLFEYISSSWFGVGPALTEFNPNFILECLSLGKPVLLSRENGLSVQLPEEFLFDPLNENEFKLKLEQFFDHDFYKTATDRVSRLVLNQTWEKVTEVHVALIKKLG